MQSSDTRKRLIGVVGPSASGKSTLIAGLEKHGYLCRHIAQDHSYVPDMWKQLTNPDVLIYLEVSFAVSLARRGSDRSLADHIEEVRRLADARAHADLLIATDGLTAVQVLQSAIDFLKVNP